ncbi:MAG: polyprenyl synthetase family protein [Deltaproteobacteria bacterium]|nr:polyprenyl synthetase family protein [Deltaproteobacteria bacterium]
MFDFDLQAYLKEKGNLIDLALDRVLPPLQILGLGRLVEAMRYSLLAPGKRLRPVLCLAGAEAVGGSASMAMPAALALEIIHAYSLVHDDLPAMDNDDLRRGLPTNHVVYGEGLAILAGDGLLTLAFEILAQAGVDHAADPKRILKTMVVIAQAAGYRGMVGGQALDLALEGQPADEEQIASLHAYKTGALIAAAVTSGAIMAGADQEQIAWLHGYGRKLGLAFQIVDDILDIEGKTEILGKKVGVDQKRGKTTYPKVVGLTRAKAMAQRLLEEASSDLADRGSSVEPLRAICRYLLTRKK